MTFFAPPRPSRLSFIGPAFWSRDCFATRLRLFGTLLGFLLVTLQNPIIPVAYSVSYARRASSERLGSG